MDPKTVTVIDADGNESNESVANDSEFKSLVDDYNVRCLVTDDSNKKKIRGFESLENGCKYTLGPPQLSQDEQTCQRVNAAAQPQPQEARSSTKVFLVNYEEMGPFTYWKELESGGDFVAEAKKFISESFTLPENYTQDDVHLACYIDGTDHHFTFEKSVTYWSVRPTSNLIFFWVGPQQPSPARDIKRLKEQVTSLTHDVKRLKAVSSTTKHRLERWSEKSELSIEEIQRSFPSPSTQTTEEASVAAAEELLEKGPAKAREEGVQEMWNQVMPHLMKNLWRDCRNPNGIQFDGRRHDIDLVILAKDVVSILYLDSSIELKDTISSDAKRREVVLQLLDRFDVTFSGQPRRQVCWGLGMDAKDVLFVKCQNNTNLSYSVSSNCSLSSLGWDLFLRFLKAPAVSRGYVEVMLPRLFGVSPQSRLGHKVYQLCDQTACKVASKEAIQQEHRMLKYVYGRAEFLIPTPRDETEYKTGCTEHPFGFRMSCLDVASVRSEDALLQLTSNIFWGLGVLHTIGVVHRDVKPSNILSGHRFEDKSSYLLCDFGMAIFWNHDESIQSAGTEAFSSISGEFQATNQNMFLRDLESLYWTALCWWLQIIKGRETPGAYTDTRQADLSVLRDRGGVFLGEKRELTCPKEPTLKHYLVEQARNKKLWQPITLYRDVVRDGMSAEEFNSCPQVYLPCPPEIFKWLNENITVEQERK